MQSLSSAVQRLQASVDALAALGAEREAERGMARDAAREVEALHAAMDAAAPEGWAL